MITVYDLATGHFLYRSREEAPMALTDKPLAVETSELQLAIVSNCGEYRNRMPPDLVDTGVDVLLTRWSR